MKYKSFTFDCLSDCVRMSSQIVNDISVYVIANNSADLDVYSSVDSLLVICRNSGNILRNLVMHRCIIFHHTRYACPNICMTDQQFS